MKKTQKVHQLQREIDIVHPTSTNTQDLTKTTDFSDNKNDNFSDKMEQLINNQTLLIHKVTKMEEDFWKGKD